MQTTDTLGQPYAPGQKIVRAYLMGCVPHLEVRTVLAVDDDGVIVSPTMGAMRPQYLRRPELAMILS